MLALAMPQQHDKILIFVCEAVSYFFSYRFPSWYPCSVGGCAADCDTAPESPRSRKVTLRIASGASQWLGGRKIDVVLPVDLSRADSRSSTSVHLFDKEVILRVRE